MLHLDAGVVHGEFSSGSRVQCRPYSAKKMGERATEVDRRSCLMCNFNSPDRAASTMQNNETFRIGIILSSLLHMHGMPGFTI
jgi:hypothetical protein